MLQRLYPYLLFMAGWLCCSAYAQESLPEGRFLSDTLKVAETVQYVLVYRHAPDLEVVFPDSAADFAPFEYVGRQYFPTQTRGGVSIDSAVYTLQSFELADLLTFAPKLKVAEKGQAFELSPAEDSVVVVQITKGQAANPQQPAEALMEDAAYANVEYPLNVYLLTLIGVALLFLLIVAVVLGYKPVMRALKLRRMKQRHERFLSAFDAKRDSLEAQDVERSVTLWKGYLAELTGYPLQTYTTREMRKAFPEEKWLYDCLRDTDRAIYSGQPEGAVSLRLEELRDFAEKRYEAALQAVKQPAKAKTEPDNRTAHDTGVFVR